MSDNPTAFVIKLFNVFKMFFKFIFLITIFFFINNGNLFTRRNSRTDCVTHRTECITSNTKRFKFSTTHNVFLICSLVKEIIRRTSFSKFSKFWIYNCISVMYNIIKVRTRKIFLKRTRV